MIGSSGPKDCPVIWGSSSSTSSIFEVDCRAGYVTGFCCPNFRTMFRIRSSWEIETDRAGVGFGVGVRVSVVFSWVL